MTDHVHTPPHLRGAVAGMRIRMRHAEAARAEVMRLHADAPGESVRERCRWVVARLAEGPRPSGVRALSLRRVQEIVSGK